jgi:hypothetical protein
MIRSVFRSFFVSIERLIESLGLSPAELKGYVLAELDEFLAAEDPADREKEFGDILFALLALGWAHSGRHYALQPEIFESKVKERLRTYAALARRPRKYHDERIAQMKIGVVHFAFGQFTGQWQPFDELRNGTVAEIHLLTDAPFEQTGQLTNHCIITFDTNDGLEYEITGASSDPAVGNTIRCRIPDFLYVPAKRELKFAEFAEYLSLQVLAALDGLRFAPGAVAHFHSWGSGFLIESGEVRSRLESFKTIFSPYLTIGRLKSVVDKAGGSGWTLTPEELTIAAAYERKLIETCARVVLESSSDREFYGKWAQPGRLDLRSFARKRAASFPSDPPDEKRLTFIAGGRPVREKGFVELCREFAQVRDWAGRRGIAVSLSILCRERRADKGAGYIREIERAVGEYGLAGMVEVEPKISLDGLRRRIAEAAALIVPSLYDPFSLMPTYAVEVRTPAFVSCHAGVSENIKSRPFTFDPQREGDLARAIAFWYEERPEFHFESLFPTYRALYLCGEVPEPWE